jgi:SAM-dependent methyltransferase
VNGVEAASDSADLRWAAARRFVRRFAEQRLPSDVTTALLPVDPGEAAAGEIEGPAVDSFEALAAIYPALLDTTHRKRNGAWFTHDTLAAPTAKRTLAPLLLRGDPARLRICDPAVGGGTFLLAALRLLVHTGARPHDAAACLHGIDVDPTAAALAALAVREACGADAPDAAVLAAHIRTGDGLFDLEDGTFDAVLTNPPWETLQAAPGVRARIDALRPYFHHQGRGKLYTYRLFVERAHRLLRAGGRFGLIVPASLWFDRDAEPLRRLLLDECDWQWLFGFENTKKIFPIDSRYRFAAVVGEKGSRTQHVRVAFGNTHAAQWDTVDTMHARYGRDELRTLSPSSGAFVEIEHERDLRTLARLHANGRPLLGSRGAFEWRQGDFNMTSDRASFVQRSHAEASGYSRGADCVWRHDEDPELLALYQGAMIGDLHPNAGGHATGTGHATTWLPADSLENVRPAYLVAAEAWRADAAERPPARIVLRTLTNATNERTAIACLLPDQPCGNSLGVLAPREPTASPLRAMAAGAAVLGSLPFDWTLRLRLAGMNLNGFVLADCVLPHLDAETEAELAALALRLCAILPWHEPLWQLADAEGWRGDARPALDEGTRRSLATRIDALTGRAYGLITDDVAWIVRDCDQLRPRSGHRKGFWRVDRTRPPEERRPVRWLHAIADVQ